MKIIIPIEFYRKGGVERVIISLITYLINYVDQVVIVLSKKQIPYFKSLLPNSEKIVYESFDLTPKSPESKLLNIFNKLLSISYKLKLTLLRKKIRRDITKYKTKARLKQLIKTYQADHCLYGIINRIEPPEIDIPLSAIAYDMFWRFSPLTYSDSYIKKYEQPLQKWLEKADVIFTISRKTRDDLLLVFSDQYQNKLKPVPLAGLQNQINNSQVNNPDSNLVTFYFPSSFGIYKDHLTLIKAGIKLAQKGLKFKIVFLGKETDSLVNGNLKLSQQKSTQEYKNYLFQCNQVYQKYQNILQDYFQGLGYCDYEQVEYCYQTCSCVVVPSQYEGFGLAISEAIMLGIPVIASNLEVFKEQVELYNSPDLVEFYPQGDVEALTQCMERFITDPKHRLSNSEIQERFSHWSWDDVAQKYVILLQEASHKKL